MKQDSGPSTDTGPWLPRRPPRPDKSVQPGGRGGGGGAPGKQSRGAWGPVGVGLSAPGLPRPHVCFPVGSSRPSRLVGRSVREECPCRGSVPSDGAGCGPDPHGRAPASRLVLTSDRRPDTERFLGTDGVAVQGRLGGAGFLATPPGASSPWGNPDRGPYRHERELPVGAVSSGGSRGHPPTETQLPGKQGSGRACVAPANPAARRPPPGRDGRREARPGPPHFLVLANGCMGSTLSLEIP